VQFRKQLAPQHRPVPTLARMRVPSSTIRWTLTRLFSISFASTWEKGLPKASA
jgi:hypothetical protein